MSFSIFLIPKLDKLECTILGVRHSLLGLRGESTDECRKRGVGLGERTPKFLFCGVELNFTVG